MEKVSDPSKRRIGVGLLGCGNVGSALVGLLEEQRSVIAERTGIDLDLVRVAVRSASRDRDVVLADGVLTTDAASVVNDPDVDVVVELIGGIEPAREMLAAALKLGKPVVTGNKELLANYGAELYGAADAAGVDLLFEAAVGGGIPLIRPLRESLAAEPVRRVMGIVNGTTNYILSQMTDHGTSYHDALADAQSLGFAERDPTADVEGFDAAAKASITSGLCRCVGVQMSTASTPGSEIRALAVRCRAASPKSTVPPPRSRFPPTPARLPASLLSSELHTAPSSKPRTPL